GGANGNGNGSVANGTASPALLNSTSNSTPLNINHHMNILVIFFGIALFL
ncbi:hypothetical protein KI387_040210, partial [Taxus chinensis]